jgi:hypothetical protein
VGEQQRGPPPGSSFGKVTGRYSILTVTASQFKRGKGDGGAAGGALHQVSTFGKVTGLYSIFNCNGI